MEEEWINDLRKKMASHQTPVPPGLWEGVEAAMKRQPAPVPLYRRRALWAVAAVGIAATVALAFFFPTRENEEAFSAASLSLVAEGMAEPADMEPSVQSGALLAMGAEDLPVARSGSVGRSVRVSASTSTSVSKSALITDISEAEKRNVDKNQSVEGKENQRHLTDRLRGADERITGVDHLVDHRTDVRMDRVSHRSSRGVTSSREKLGLQVYLANMPHTARHTSGYGEFVAGTALPHKMQGSGPEPVSPGRDIVFSNLGQKVETRKKHKLPVKFGVSLRYQFHGGWSLESGLFYTYLGSELTSGSEEHHFITRQTLQYLGVPLLVGWDIWENRWWKFYTSAGGTLEKCIHGQSETDFIVSLRQVSSQKQNVMDRPLQWAAVAAAGVQLNLTPRVGLYLEPGISYYFDNGSVVETIYKDQPFNFNFKVGLRFGLN